MAAPAPAQQPPPTPTPARPGQVVTRIDVDILELDVLVLDGKDRPVPDLTRDDFEVRIAGTLQPIEFFDPPAAPRAGAGAALPAGTPPAEVVAGTTTPARPGIGTAPHVLFFFDLEQLPESAIREAAPAVEQAVGLIPAPVRFSVVSYFVRPATLVWEDEVLDRVTAALETMEAAAAQEARDSAVSVRSGGSGSAAGVENPHSYEARQQVERQLLDGLVQAIDLARTTRDPRPVAEAWRQIGQYLQGERYRARDLLQGLRGVCQEYADLDGRKTLVFVSRGFERYPGFNLLNSAEAAARSASTGNTLSDPRIAAAMPGMPGSGAGGLSATPLSEYDDFVRWLAGSGITLHFLDPSRATDLPTAEQGRGERNRPLSGERKNLQEAGTNLATVTGGISRLQPGDLGPSLATIVDATSGAYRLGLRMTDVDPRRSYKVDIRVKRPGARALSRTAYRPKLPTSAAPAAVAGADRQRLRSNVDERRPGAARQVAKPIAVVLAWKGKSAAPAIGGRNLYKLDVRIPYDDLRFLPEEDGMVASTRIDIVADSAEGKGRDTFTEDLFLTMSGVEYSAASGSEAVKTLTLTLPPGKWNLSVSVTDLLETHTGIARATVVAEP
jgi:VWFA-related protein